VRDRQDLVRRCAVVRDKAWCGCGHSANVRNVDGAGRPTVRESTVARRECGSEGRFARRLQRLQRIERLRKRALPVHSEGAVLPIVLLISSLMLTTSAAWFETSLASARASTNVRDSLQAFHAADSALTLCARNIEAGTATVLPAVAGEPAGWTLASKFAAAAFAPLAQWPGSLQPPQCIVEAWRLATRPDARAYLLTARGFGRTVDSQAWLQMELVIDGEKTERHWRHVAARPF
jgi:hypothetical protein